MDYTKPELEAVSAASDSCNDVMALTELELSLVGGGQGDVSFG